MVVNKTKMLWVIAIVIISICILSALLFRSSIDSKKEEVSLNVQDSKSSNYDCVNEVALDEINSLIDEAPIVRIFNLIVSQAIKEQAAEIQIIFDEIPDKFTVYYIVDGVKHEVMQPSNDIKSKLINHAKVIANLDIVKKNFHQDGKIYFKENGHRHEAKVFIVPSVNGKDENVIIKILN